jgi:hypothetical protein
MAKHLIHPFQNESECLQIGELTVENRVDRISIYGSLDLTLDKEGMEMAQLLKTVIDLALAQMAMTELPDRISIEKTEAVTNPFE